MDRWIETHWRDVCVVIVGVLVCVLMAKVF